MGPHQVGNLRELLEGNIGFAAQVLKALVGDVVIEARPVEARRSPVACIGNPDPGGMQVNAPLGEETFDDATTTETA